MSQSTKALVLCHYSHYHVGESQIRIGNLAEFVGLVIVVALIDLQKASLCFH